MGLTMTQITVDACTLIFSQVKPVVQIREDGLQRPVIEIGASTSSNLIHAWFSAYENRLIRDSQLRLFMLAVHIRGELWVIRPCTFDLLRSSCNTLLWDIVGLWIMLS
jgi:hypothetical protein